MAEKEVAAAPQHGAEKAVDHHDEKNELAPVDTVHGDEAQKILATYTGDLEWSEKEEKVLTRKIDRKLIPMLCITYALQYYDKAMLSQAVRPTPLPTLPTSPLTSSRLSSASAST